MIKTTFFGGINCFTGKKPALERLTASDVCDFFESLKRPGTTRECAIHFDVDVVRPKKICKILADRGHLRSVNRTGRGSANHFVFVSKPASRFVDHAGKYFDYISANPMSTSKEIRQGTGDLIEYSTAYEIMLKMTNDGKICRKKIGINFVYWITE
jgi:hypothetical protein